MNYTLGEWQAKGQRIISVENDGDVIAFARKPALMPADQALTNARLIAAAPDMYKALKELGKVLFIIAANMGPCELKIKIVSVMAQGSKALALAEGK